MSIDEEKGELRLKEKLEEVEPDEETDPNVMGSSSGKGNNKGKGPIKYLSCNDSDGGKVYDVFGAVTVETDYKGAVARSVLPDSCNGGSGLDEYYCGRRNKLAVSSVTCQYGCSNGRCLTEPVQTCSDSDNDGYGSPASDICKYNIADCNDNDPYINPGTEDICGNGIDEDCNGSDKQCPAICSDYDGDGYGNPASNTCIYMAQDCNDENSTVHPSAEDICGNGIDEDCSGSDKPCSPTTGQLYWTGNAETGDFSQWCNVGAVSQDRVQIVTSPVKDGNYAYRFELRDGDDYYGERVVLNQSNPPCDHSNFEVEGEEKYYGFSVYLPVDFPKYPAWSLVAQWKADHTGSPPLQMGLAGDLWKLYYRPNTSSGNILKWTTPVTKGRWESFVYHVKWSRDPSVGFIELWYNGTKVVPLFHTSTVHVVNGEAVPNFVEIGNYRDASISSNVVLYHDGYKVGSTYESVAQ